MSIVAHLRRRPVLTILMIGALCGAIPAVGPAFRAIFWTPTDRLLYRANLKRGHLADARGAGADLRGVELAGGVWPAGVTGVAGVWLSRAR